MKQAIQVCVYKPDMMIFETTPPRSIIHDHPSSHGTTLSLLFIDFLVTPSSIFMVKIFIIYIYYSLYSIYEIHFFLIFHKIG